MERIARPLTPAGFSDRLPIRPSSAPSLPLLGRSIAVATNAELYDAAVKLKDEGKLEEACAKLQEILAGTPNYALAHSALSVYLGRLQRHDEAIAHARKVCELEPHDPRSFISLSVVCVKAGRIQEAEDAKARASMLQAAMRH